LLKQKDHSWETKDPFQVCQHKLETKYYSAQLEFWVCSAQRGYDHIEQTLVTLGETTDALLFLFEEGQDVLAELNKWSKFIEEYSPNVLVCACDNKPQDQVPDEDILSNHKVYTSWCLDNGLEFILLNPSGNSSDPELREKKGFERVLEVLETNMWENMDYATQLRPQVKGLSIQPTQTSTNAVIPQEQSPQEKKIVDNIFENLDIHVGPTETAPKDLGNNENPFLPQDFFDELSNFEDGGFEKALLQLKTLREKASKLSDTERREMAAQVALSFLQHTTKDDE